KINKIAIPTMLQQSTVSLGLILVQALVNSYGADIVSGYTAATKIDSLAVMPIINLSNAVSTFTAQNAGAKLIDRIKEGYKAALKLTL
ncbi:Mate efflux family protein, partial [human gut metagenome]